MSREEVIRRLVRREEQQQSFVDQAVLQDDAELYVLACEYFGTWEIALKYAGIEIPQPRWSREKVIVAFQLRQQHGLSVKSVWRDDKPLARAALYYFGTMKNARLAAGVEGEADQE